MVEQRKKGLRDVFLRSPVPFSGKRDVNWIAIRNVFLAIGLIVLVAILLIPSSQEEIPFKVGDDNNTEAEVLPSYREPLDISSSIRGYRAAMGHSASGGTSPSRSRNGSMIIAREGLDPSSQLPPGSRVRVRLLERVVVSSQSMPVIGIVTEDCTLDGTLAIPKGSSVFGEVVFDSDLRRGVLTWRSIQIGGTRVRQFDALSTALDGQAGIEGRIHSDALKNSVGQTMTRFIGAYAEGSMERSSFFGNPGGKENGLKNAVAETAKDQAERMADRMKKEREWLELKPETEFLALLTQPFRFRDPGGAY